MAEPHRLLEKLDQLKDRLNDLQESQNRLEMGLEGLKVILTPPRKAILPPQDGPQRFEVFRLKGKEYKGFSLNEWRLLEYLWGKPAVPIQDAVDHVYGHDSGASDSAINSLKKRLNKRLRRMSCPARVSAQHGHYALRTW